MRGICRRFILFLMTAVAVFAFLLLPPASAGADGTLLSDAQVEYLFSQEQKSGESIVQSVCATDQYIITLENTSKNEITADVVTAYYKNDTDASGNPVERYSVAMRAEDQDWEHGNCMTYNPNTGYIYVALYTNFNPDLKGCIYVMDPADLRLVGVQKVTDEYNLLSVAYDPAENVYYAQADGDGSYRMLKLDLGFHILEDLGPADPTPGYNFQGFCKSGNYLLQSPLTYGLDVGDYMMAYSIPEQTFVDCVAFNYGRRDASKVEPEQIAPLGDGSFTVVVNNSYQEESAYADIYRVTFPNLPDDNTLLPSGASMTAGSMQAGAAGTDEEVTITTEKEEMTSVETPSIGDEPEEAAGPPFDPLPVILVAVIAAAAVFGIRVYRINLERKRRIRNARARRARKLLKESLEREAEELRF